MPDLKKITPKIQFHAHGADGHHFDHKHVHYGIDANGVVTLTFDREGSSANIFDEHTFAELEDILDHIEGHSELSGVVLRSAKDRVFIAGADLKHMSACVHGPATDRDALRELIARGQAAFDRLANLPVPKVAIIHGACLGGGLEIALACDWRVATFDRVTKIGLPETQLGILPAWGGSTRLPKLIGLDRALEIAVPAKSVVGKKALSLGMVDEVAHREQLMNAAMHWLKRGRRMTTTKAVNLPAVRDVVATLAQKRTLKKTCGNYPAQERVIDVMKSSLAVSHEQSLRNELDAVLDLAATNACRNLLNIYFLQERAKKATVGKGAGDRATGERLPQGARASRPFERDAPLPETSETSRKSGFKDSAGSAVTRDPVSIDKVAVIGAGVMGAGIAQWCAARGSQVILKDLSPDAMAAGMTTVRKRFDEAVKRHVFTRGEAANLVENVTPSVGEVSLKSRQIVVEAAVETLAVKQAIFKELAETAAESTILATNTSALSIHEIAKVTPHPERVIGMHFFNPVHRMPLVEVVHTELTDPDVIADAVAFVRSLGKTPVVAKDSPGFIVNRILMPYLIEAGYLFSRHIDAHRIDRVMVEFGMPMGPLRLLDEVGLDVALHVARTLSEAMPGRFTTPEVIERLVASGDLGRKSGRGFYSYDTNSRRNGSLDVNPGALSVCGNDLEPDLESDDELRLRLSLLMSNEALLCLEEDVAASAGDIDLAMVMGTGYAPFLGGPLRHCETRGLNRTADQLHGFWKSTGREIFKPADYLRAHDSIFTRD